MIAKRGASFIAAFFLLVSATLTLAEDETHIDGSGIALNGFDPVAYFESGKPVRGRSDHASRIEGITYFFASRENQIAFEREPDRYRPAYGGWCSYGIRVGKKYATDPAAWTIVDGRLFLHLNLGTKKVWSIDRDKNIEVADRLWPQIKTISKETLGD